MMKKKSEESVLNPDMGRLWQERRKFSGAVIHKAVMLEFNKEIAGEDIVESVRAALQYISYYHTPDYLRHLAAAYEREESASAKAAIGQILESSRLAATGQRPMCQDTGMVTVFARLGQSCVIRSDKSLEELINEGTRLAYMDSGNPLRASMVADPIYERKNTRDNTPAITHIELGLGNTLEILVAAKGSV